MLIEFRVANFRSFHEEQTLSLVAGKDDAHPDNLITAEKFSLLKSAAIYGANASGKSNLIKAIDTMRSFVKNSATKMNQGDKIPGISPFRLAVDSREKPSSFEVTIIIDETRYEYGFSATSDRVHDEWLSAYPPPHKKRQRWFERQYNPKTGTTEWKFRGPLKADEKILESKTRDNGLVLSRGAELNIEALKAIFMWFRKKLWLFDMTDPPDNLIQIVAKRLKDDEKFRNRVLKMLQHADTGIDGLNISEEPRSVLAQVLNENYSEKRKPNFRVSTTHYIDGSESCDQFDLVTDESKGTQRFFALAPFFLAIAQHGGLIVIDEIECSMHPLLTRKLIELFQSPEANKNAAQLIFATHDSTLMDPELFRRDQLWIAEKNRTGASELFSLYDFDTAKRPRSTTAFQRNYLAGRYGGVPKFGPIFEDLELK